MAAHVVIELDTTAPDVTWGTPDGAVAGETLSVPYLTDEAIESAVIVLSNDVELAMIVGAGELTVDLPNDASDGTATVYARDDVGNAATLSFYVSGALPEAPAAPRRAGGVPNLPAKLSTGTTTARFTSRTRIRQRATHVTLVETRTRYREHARARGAERMELTTRFAPVASLRHGSHMMATTTDTITRQNEPPGGENELAIIELL